MKIREKWHTKDGKIENIQSFGPRTLPCMENIIRNRFSAIENPRALHFLAVYNQKFGFSYENSQKMA